MRNLRIVANQIAAAINAMLHTAPAADEAWNTPVMLTQAESGEGIEALGGQIQDHRTFLTDSGKLHARREARRKAEFVEAVEETLSQRLKMLIDNDPALAQLIENVASKQAEPYSAAVELLNSQEPILDLANTVFGTPN